jgi:hypothetical protein
MSPNPARNQVLAIVVLDHVAVLTNGVGDVSRIDIHTPAAIVLHTAEVPVVKLGWEDVSAEQALNVLVCGDMCPGTQVWVGERLVQFPSCTTQKRNNEKPE